MSPDIQKGEAVVRALDEAGLEVRAASWLRLAEAPDWRLVLAMPLVDKEGPRAGYGAIRKTLARPRDLRKAIADIRVSDNIVDGVLVQDAYIYRSS